MNLGYRVLYEWVPQLLQPEEIVVPHLDIISKFRVPGVPWQEEQRITKVEGAKGFAAMPQLCVVEDVD